MAWTSMGPVLVVIGSAETRALRPSRASVVNCMVVLMIWEGL